MFEDLAPMRIRRLHSYSFFYKDAKGQLILEGNFGVFKSLKKRTKFFEEFLPQPLNGSNKKNANYYINANQRVFSIKKCRYLSFYPL